MAERNKDNLADALAALAAGHHEDDEHPTDQSAHDDSADHSEPEPARETPKPVSTKKLPPPMLPSKQAAAPAPPAKPARPDRPDRPAGPVPAPAVAKTTPPPVPTRSARPSAPSDAQPSQPAPPPPKRSARPDRPAAPGSPAIQSPGVVEAVVDAQDVYTDQTDTDASAAQEAEDDAAVLAPAAPFESLAHTPYEYKRPKRVPFHQTLSFKQTTIPIGLTLGALLPLVAVLPFVMNEDSAMGALREHIWFSSAFAAVGLLMLGYGVYQMFEVKKELERTPPAPAGAKKKR